MSLEEEIEEAIVAWDEDKLKKLCKSSIESGDAGASKLLRIIGRIMRKIGKLF